MKEKVTAIVLAAGKGSRMHSEIQKQYMTLLDRPVITYALEAFEKREQMLKLRERVLKAEQERIEGQPTMSVSEARRRLRERANEV